MEEWRFQEKALKFIKTWPIMIFVFVGSGILLGSLVHFFPPIQKATAELYIGIDMTRVNDVASLASYAKTEPFNIDDYKNWQLSQVDAIASSEYVADLALADLRIQDDYWEDVSTIDFIDMQDIDWYDVGVWKIKIQAQDGKYSLQGVNAWREVLFEELTRLITESEDVLYFESRVRATNKAITTFEIRLIELNDLINEIDARLTVLNGIDPDSKLTESDREDLNDLIIGASIEDILWTHYFIDFPDPGQTVQTFIDWLGQTLILVTSEKEFILRTIDNLETDLDSIIEDYIREIYEAQGLSASLYIEYQVADPYLETYYPDSIVGFIGSIAGLLIYIILWVMINEVKVEKE